MTNTENIFFITHVFSCFFMTGVIWIVQLLVYPFFKMVGKNEFHPLHQFHMQKITWVVAPVMTVELLTGLYLLILSPELLFIFNFVSVGILWLLTALINVPTHNHLNAESEASKTNLVLRNWPRTIIWTIRSIFLILVMVMPRG